MSEQIRRKSTEQEVQTTQIPKSNKIIRVWNNEDSYKSAEIQESDLEVWIKAGYTTKQPEVVLQASEKAILLRKTMGM